MQKLSKLATALIVGAMMSATAMAAGKAFVTVNGTAVSQSIADVFISEQKAKGAPDSAELKNAVREELIRRELLVQEAKKAGIPIRIGVNGGSLEKDILEKYKGVTPVALVESALRNIELMNKLNFDDLVVSIKTF